jgi:RNA polymerase sigma factor for flagellar operon FliA
LAYQLRAAVNVLTVTTETRARYLEALGIDLTESESSRDSLEPNRVSGSSKDDATTTSEPIVRPADSAEQAADPGFDQEFPEKTAETSHFGWLSADGEWERLIKGLAHSTASSVVSSSVGPHTLAGSVAEISNDSQLDLTWARYKDKHQQGDRDQLILYYAPLVKYVAGRIAAGLPQNVDQSDLVSYGMFGLIDAITKFDPERGFKFETYAISRIKGAVLDELRSIDWVPRSVRAKAKSVERAMAKLESVHHRAPTDEEIAEELDMSMTQLNNIYNQISSLGVVAMDEMLSFGGGDTMSFGDTLADRRDGPGGQYERVEMRQLLGDAINRMGEREKIVLTLYYYESLTLAQIGNVLGVTESRVCQIHTKAVLQLRSRLQAADREAV